MLPAKGSDTRQFIKDKAKDAVRMAKAKAEDFQERAAEVAEDVRGKAAETRARGEAELRLGERGRDLLLAFSYQPGFR